MMTPHGPAQSAGGMSKTAVAFLFLFIGLLAGFFAGIGATKAGAAFLEDLASSEAPADLVNVQSYVRPGFSFKYPGNWKVEADSPENDPDHHVNVESPGSCMTMIFVFDAPTEPADNVQAQIDGFVPKLLSAPARTPFTMWGRYAGQGMLLKGKLLGVSAGSVRVFSHANDKRSFITVEQCYDEDMTHVKPGLELVESSFKFSP
ncbi:hypothetical protein WME79_30125 [Sorangium sp. So ce726]|uniref:hypothetical protein n=1 Tax=Sorangium sp. So ce726 TaxID=3133319 RepID=UPI003F5E8EB7